MCLSLCTPCSTTCLFVLLAFWSSLRVQLPCTHAAPVPSPDQCCSTHRTCVANTLPDQRLASASTRAPSAAISSQCPPRGRCCRTGAVTAPELFERSEGLAVSCSYPFCNFFLKPQMLPAKTHVERRKYREVCAEVNGRLIVF